jgi:NAD(P)-dependent dehydrogenase (short-subunit alcohol dehydrogenase family)
MNTAVAKVLLVTGGSRGIGAACCRRAAAHGWDVAVNYTRDAAAAGRVAADVRARGRRAITVAADVADEAQVLAMFRRIDTELGPLDALVNNAGVVDQPQRVQDMTVARLRRMFDTNILGSFLCAREAIRRMHGRGGGIVNLSSAAARLGSPGQYVDYMPTRLSRADVPVEATWNLDDLFPDDAAWEAASRPWMPTAWRSAPGRGGWAPARPRCWPA